MIQNLAENEKYTINYFKNGQRKSLDLLEVLNQRTVEESGDIIDVLYETDGTEGFLGINSMNGITNQWQFNCDFSPYKMVYCYFKQSDFEAENKNMTPAIMVDINLDEKSLAKAVNSTNIGGNKKPCDIYLGSKAVICPNDLMSIYGVSVAINNEKNKLQVVGQYSINGSTMSSRNNNGRYLYKIIGVKR